MDYETTLLTPEVPVADGYRGAITARAITLLQDGQPLPMDLVSDLLEHGVDVEALEQEHA